MSKRETAAEKIAKLEAENLKLTRENTILNTRIAYMMETFNEFAGKVMMLGKQP